MIVVSSFTILLTLFIISTPPLTSAKGDISIPSKTTTASTTTDAKHSNVHPTESPASNYPNPLGITPEMQRLFHPVVKFPLRNKNERDRIRHACASDSFQDGSAEMTMDYDYDYTVLDCTRITGESQLISPNEVDAFRRRRKAQAREWKKRRQWKTGRRLVLTLVSFLVRARNRSSADDCNSCNDENVCNTVSSKEWGDGGDDHDGDVNYMTQYTVGKYDENRANLYSSSHYLDPTASIDGYGIQHSNDNENNFNGDGGVGYDSNNQQQLRTLHVGVDLGGPIGTKVHAFWDGVVHSCGYNPDLGDYGNVIVVEHTLPDVGGDAHGSARDDNDQVLEKKRVWALYGHLDSKITSKNRVGDRIKRGQVLGRLGDVHENGGWSIPHVHFQLSIAPPETHDMPGAVAMKDRSRALVDYPDPRFVLGPLY